MFVNNDNDDDDKREFWKIKGQKNNNFQKLGYNTLTIVRVLSIIIGISPRD